MFDNWHPTYDEGDKCPEPLCNGQFGYVIENCYCHMGHPPCGACTGAQLECTVCGTPAAEEE